MESVLRRLRPLHPLLVALGLLAATPCAARETVVRVGLPHAYERDVQERAGRAARCAAADACVRYRYAPGSDYQVLEWLQNGKVDGAIVSTLALELVRRTVGAARFKQDFLVDAQLPLDDLALRRYHIALRAESEGLPLPDAEAQLGRLFQDLLAGTPRDDTVVELPSHLSAGVVDLHARVQAWAERPGRGAGPQRAREALMNALLPRLRFAAAGAAGARLRLILEEREGGPPLAHVFLVRRLALPAPLSGGDWVPPLDAESAFLDYLAGAAESGAPDSELRRFAAGNYVSESAGWRNRFRFAFTLDELRGILRAHAADPAEDDGIALVLTGGGVKAAYQTKLIDHLYGSGYLRNRFVPGEPDPAAVPVKYVVGTSGGALLGIFVASLDDSFPKPDLSTKLWYRHENGKPVGLLSSAEVFPAVDLMRWLSLVWCLAIFTAVCGAASMYLRRMRGYAPADACDEGSRFWRLSFWWLALLAATPWLLVHVNGRHGAEHIPAIQGVFYFVFLLIAIYSDNRLVVRQTARQGASARPPAAAAACGIALIAAALYADREDPVILSFLDFPITLPALLACLGVLLIFLGLHWWFSRCARRLEPIPRQALPAFLLLAGVCALCYALLWAAVQLGFGTLFELTLEFWVVLGVISLLVSALLLLLAYGVRLPVLRRRFDYLLAAHPSRCAERLHWISTARYSRMILGFTLGWV
jgi:hypothetical protein